MAITHTYARQRVRLSNGKRYPVLAVNFKRMEALVDMGRGIRTWVKMGEITDATKFHGRRPPIYDEVVRENDRS